MWHSCVGSPACVRARELLVHQARSNCLDVFVTGLQAGVG